VRMTKMQLMYVFTFLALILYVFQFFYQNIDVYKWRLKKTRITALEK